MSAPASSRRSSGTQTARVPDFFIVGHHKSGTTALYEMLGQHPQIFMSDIKEPRFLAEDAQPLFPNPRARRLPQTLEQYLALFADAREDQRAGEATPAYLWSQTAASRIAQLQPDARIIALLREPASFIRSLHLQLLRSHVETEKDLRRALELESQRRAGRAIPRRSHLPQLLLYSDHVRYVEQLRRYHERFPAEQVMVIIYEDFRDDNIGTVRQVLSFLGVDDTHSVQPVSVKRTTRTMRSAEVDDLLWALTLGRSPLSRAARGLLTRLTPRELRLRAMRTVRRRAVFAPAEQPDERLMLELRRRFEPEVRALGEYLGRDLITRWGYQDL